MHDFVITEAYAQWNDRGGVDLTMMFPDNKRKADSLRFRACPDVGVQVNKSLLEAYGTNQEVRIAYEHAPFKPASAGGVVFLDKGETALSSLRNTRPRTHTVYQSWYGGFPTTEEGVYSVKALENTALREMTEEILLLYEGKLVQFAQDEESGFARLRAKQAGITYESVLTVEPQFIPSKDTLRVVDERGNSIYETSDFHGEWMLEQTSSTNWLMLPVLDLPSEGIIAVDCEGTDNPYNRFNLPVFHMRKQDVDYMQYGAIMKSYTAFTHTIEEGKVVQHEYRMRQPCEGPDRIPTHDVVFAPEDGLTKALTAAGWHIRIDDTTGHARHEKMNWLAIEYWKEQKMLLQQANYLTGRTIPAHAWLCPEESVDFRRIAQWTPRWLESSPY